MSIAPGTRLGPYHIVSPLGAGGMGEVYRARDVRLQREVAIKVLPGVFAADPERLERFEQEARAAAALNHANILAVYDFGEHEGAPFIVSELLEGQTLRAWLDGGALPPRKAIEIATEIATGLAAAHEKGIVHRDLKPENVFVNDGGHAKILDFGLAKLTQGEPAAIGLTSVPTTPPAHGGAAPNTLPGVVMGTVGYMAPEQVRGVAADHRADIFSLGVLLYEMLAGRRAFSGDTNADVMSAILRADPPEFDERTTVAASVVRVVSRCLEKQPASRFQSASDLAFALQSAGSDTRSSGSTAAMPAEPARRRGAYVAIGAAFAIVAALAGLGTWKWWPVAAATPVVRAELALPANLQLGPNVALSPDGRQVVFTATQATSRTSTDAVGSLWLRVLATGAMRELPNTDRARTPFWSPDGAAIGFFSDTALRIVDLASGRVRVVCPAPGARTWGTWNNTGTIVFATENGQPLMRVEADGRARPVPATRAFGLRPSFLPDGTHFVFIARTLGEDGPGRPELAVGELGRTETTSLNEWGTEPHFMDGYLLFGRDDVLLAQPFDLARRRLSGMAVPLAEISGHQGNGTGPNLAVAGDVVVFTNVPRDEHRLAWRSRDGSPLNVIDADGDWRNPDLSPDGTRLVAARTGRDGTSANIWTVDLATGGLRQLVATPATEHVPFWSPDGRRLIFLREGDAEGLGTFEKALDESTERPLIKGIGNASALTKDGRMIVGFRISDGNRGIVFGPLDGSTPLAPFAEGPGNETQPALSPDNRWLAYVSDEIGPSVPRAVFVQAFPGGGQKVQVSTAFGGVQPRWRRDGRELLFVDDEGWITSAPVVSGGEPLRFGPVSRLFKTDIAFLPGLGTRANYDVTNDGKRFIVSEARQATAAASIEVIMNWKQLLAGKAAH